MPNIQIIDSAENCVYDVFAASQEDFDLLFQESTDIAFSEELFSRRDSDDVEAALSRLWKCRIRKSDAMGIHGVIFFGMPGKQGYYPTRRDEEAQNPDGSRLRA